MRSESSIEQQLRDLHAPHIEPPRPSERSEAEALLAWAERHAAANEPAPMSAWSKLALALAGRRLAVAFATVFVLVFGACVLPTSYEIPLGLSIEIRPAAGEQLPIQDIERYVEQRSGATEVQVLLREVVSDGGEPVAGMWIRLWDQNLALGEIEPELRERFPSLASAEIRETALAGEVETIWGRRFAHRALQLPPREADVEHARRMLLMQLHEQGFEAHEVVVKVRDREDGRREVEVQVERSLSDGPLPRGAEFQWVTNGEPPTRVQLDAPPSGQAVRIHVGGDEQR